MNFIIDNWELILAGLTPIAGWFGGRKMLKSQLKKSNEEAKDIELNNISSNFKLYQDVINDLEDRFKKRIEELELDLEKIRTLNSELRKVVRNQENYINKLREKIKSYEKLEE